MKTTPNLSLVHASPYAGKFSFARGKPTLLADQQAEGIRCRPSFARARELADALHSVSIEVDDAQSEDEIHSCVLVRLRHGAIEFIGVDSNLQVWKSVRLRAWGGDAFSVAVNAEDLYSALAFSGNDEIELEYEVEGLHIRGNGYSFWLQGCPGGDSPLLLPVFDVSSVSLRIPRARFEGLLNQVKHAMASHDARASLNGMLFAFEGRDFSLTATDGYRLAFAHAPIWKEMPAQQFIVPYLAMHGLHRLLRTEEACDDGISMHFAQGSACFSVNGFELTTRLLHGPFPDTNRVLVEKYDTEVMFNRDALTVAIRRAAFIDDERIVTMRLGNDKLLVSAKNEDWGSAVTTLPADYDDSPLKNLFSSRYLLDALQTMSGEQVIVQFQHGAPVVLLRAPGDDGVRHVIMGLRS